MKRSHIALGASVLALAMTGGPAWAAPTQTIDDSIGGAQVASVAVDAPVRVLSDGNNGSGAPGAGGPQAIDDSVGAVQAGPVAVDAPVRVLSDGDNGSGARAGAGGPQAIDDSVGAVQAGPVDAQAPVRVASDGENRSSSIGSGGQQRSDDSVGTVQVGATDVRAPIRVLSDGDDEGAGSGSNPVTPGSQSSTDSVGVVQIAPVRLSLPVRLLSDGDDGYAVASVLGRAGRRCRRIDVRLGGSHPGYWQGRLTELPAHPVRRARTRGRGARLGRREDARCVRPGRPSGGRAGPHRASAARLADARRGIRHPDRAGLTR